jgi:hypothetical protein
MVQQSTRRSANDLPLMTAQLVKKQLVSGAAPSEVVPTDKTDLRSDFAVFVIITDDSRHVLASSANLDGKTPLPPAGTFNFTAAHGSDNFTWQPTSGVRLATEMLSFNDGFIISGQSLKPFEDKVAIYNSLALAALLAVLAWISVFLLLPVQKIMVRRKS